MIRFGYRALRRGQYCSGQKYSAVLQDTSSFVFLRQDSEAEEEQGGSQPNSGRSPFRSFASPLLGGWRSLQTSSGGDTGNSNGSQSKDAPGSNGSNGLSKSGSSRKQVVGEMESILQRIDAAHFTEVLQHEAKTRWNISEAEFTRLCTQCGAANSEHEALQICEALDKSGVVLRIKNLVYLRPLEVAEILFKALPDTATEVRARLDQLKEEAAPLLAKKATVDAQANRYAKVILWTGFALFTAQMILYARLTFWELSWDVMEPITYFTSATFAILAYIYCMWHNEEFGVLSARRRLSVNMQNKKYAEKGLDTSKLEFLLHRINRLEATISPVDLSKSPRDKKGDGEGAVTDPIGLQPVGQGVV